MFNAEENEVPIAKMTKQWCGYYTIAINFYDNLNYLEFKISKKLYFLKLYFMM